MSAVPPTSATLATLATRAATRRRRIALIAALVVALVLPFIPPFTGEDYRRWLVGAAFMAAQAVAFDFTAGYINIVNFGFAAFVGLGGYTSGLLAVGLGIPPLVGMVVGGHRPNQVGQQNAAPTHRHPGI